MVVVSAGVGVGVGVGRKEESRRWRRCWSWSTMDASFFCETAMAVAMTTTSRLSQPQRFMVI